MGQGRLTTLLMTKHFSLHRLYMYNDPNDNSNAMYSTTMTINKHTSMHLYFIQFEH